MAERHGELANDMDCTHDGPILHDGLLSVEVEYNDATHVSNYDASGCHSIPLHNNDNSSNHYGSIKPVNDDDYKQI